MTLIDKVCLFQCKICINQIRRSLNTLNILCSYFLVLIFLNFLLYDLINRIAAIVISLVAVTVIIFTVHHMKSYTSDLIAYLYPQLLSELKAEAKNLDENIKRCSRLYFCIFLSVFLPALISKYLVIVTLVVYILAILTNLVTCRKKLRKIERSLIIIEVVDD